MKQRKKCPHCEKINTIKWGFYKRKVIDESRTVDKIKVQRYKCKDCEKTFSFLPNGIQRGCTYSESAKRDMIENKYWYESGLRKVGGKPWEPVQYSATSIWNIIQETGPISRKTLNELEVPFNGTVLYDEKFFNCNGGWILWAVAAIPTKENEYAVIVAEESLYVEGDEETRKDKRKLRKKLKKRKKPFVKKFLQFVKRRLDGKKVKTIVTDEDTIYPAIIKDVFPGAQQQLCIKHVQDKICKAFKKEFGRHLPENIRKLKKKALGISKVKTKEEGIELINQVLEEQATFKEQGPVTKRLKRVKQKQDAVFHFTSSDCPMTNNGMEHIFSRVAPLGKIMKSFQSESGGRNFLSNSAMWYNGCPFVDGNHKGESPLQLAGIEVESRPFWYL